MDNEYQALLHWSLVPRSSSMNIIGCKWVYKLKTKVDGIGRYKTRLVAKGFNQKEAELFGYIQSGSPPYNH